MKNKTTWYFAIAYMTPIRKFVAYAKKEPFVNFKGGVLNKYPSEANVIWNESGYSPKAAFANLLNQLDTHERYEGKKTIGILTKNKRLEWDRESTPTPLHIEDVELFCDGCQKDVEAVFYIDIHSLEFDISYCLECLKTWVSQAEQLLIEGVDYKGTDW